MVASDDAPGFVRRGTRIGGNTPRDEPGREVTDEPDNLLFSTAGGPDRIRIRRRSRDPFAGRSGAGASTPAKDPVSGWVEVASRSERDLPVVGSMALGHRPEMARPPDRRNATAPGGPETIDRVRAALHNQSRSSSHPSDVSSGQERKAMVSG